MEKSGDRVGTSEGRHTCVMEGPRSGVRVIVYFCVREAYTCKSGVGPEGLLLIEEPYKSTQYNDR